MQVYHNLYHSKSVATRVTPACRCVLQIGSHRHTACGREENRHKLDVCRLSYIDTNLNDTCARSSPVSATFEFLAKTRASPVDLLMLSLV